MTYCSPSSRVLWMPEDHPLSVELPDKFLLEIGRISISWTDLENVLHNCLVRVLGHTETDIAAHAVFIHMAFPQKLNVLKTMLGELQNPPISLEQYKEVERRLNEAQQKRNAIFHQRWGVEGGKVFRIDVKARGTLKFTYTPVSFQELLADELLIQEAALLLSHRRLGRAHIS